MREPVVQKARQRTEEDLVGFVVGKRKGSLIDDMAVNLEDGITMFQGGGQNGIDGVGRPGYAIRGASSALLMSNQMNFAHDEDVPRCAAPSATEKQGDRFLSVSWKQMRLQRLVLSVGEA